VTDIDYWGSTALEDDGDSLPVRVPADEIDGGRYQGIPAYAVIVVSYRRPSC
jgi:hypothetical protein